VIESRALVCGLGGVGSIFLHLLLFTGAMWGAHHTLDPTREPRWATPPSSREFDEIAMQWMLIDERALSDPTAAAPAAGLSAPSLKWIPVRVDFPIEMTWQSEAADGEDTGESGRLVERYLDQINARIDRAWLRPRSAIGAVRFHCQVRIEQDMRGNVSEVMLEQCNGTPSWQLSLIHAIQSASPLPAPPDPSMFVRAIHASFQAGPFGPGSPIDQYEPEIVARATVPRNTP
jgi:hypothetical protein